MSKFVIEGNKRLSGDIFAQANKNAVLPILAATLLTDEPCVLKNVPKILDVAYMLEILGHIGTTVTSIDETTLKLQTPKIVETDLPKELVRKLRASVLLMGAMVGRAGKVSTHHPGGDVIGKRPITTHLLAFSDLGVKVSQQDSKTALQRKKMAAATIFLDDSSVTATENVLLIAATMPKTIIIKHAAAEPHVQELCHVLQKMGVLIHGIGSNTITITGKEHLTGFDHTIESDHIEVGTWAILAGVTNSAITIRNARIDYLDMILLVLERFGLQYTFTPTNASTSNVHGSLKIIPKDLLAVEKVDAYPWPGFPTDLISLVIVLATQARGTTLVRDWMFEGRMFFVDKLITMGSHIILCDPHRVVVSGPAQLYGRDLDSPDIRAGMALVLAALCAKGTSVISNIELIERGYARIQERLTRLGASIQKIDD